MKKIFFLTTLLFTAAFFSQSVKAQTEAQRIELCTKVAGADATFQSSYPVRLEAAESGQRPPDFKQGFGLIKGNRYRFTICTDKESSGEAILQLFDQGKMIGTSYLEDSGKTFQSFDFDCTKSALYVIIIKFKDGKEGSAVAVVSHVKTL
jgi:hypothetical protein